MYINMTKCCQVHLLKEYVSWYFVQCVRNGICHDAQIPHQWHILFPNDPKIKWWFIRYRWLAISIKSKPSLKMIYWTDLICCDTICFYLSNAALNIFFATIFYYLSQHVHVCLQQICFVTLLYLFLSQQWNHVRCYFATLC